jgi:hypothetical protein
MTEEPSDQSGDEPADEPGTATGAELRRLQHAYPGWHVWNVLTWDGTRNGIVWCAQRHRDGRLVEADTAGRLAAYIADADLPVG